jgi:hypothetical protein
VKLTAVLWTVAAVDASVGKANWMVTALTTGPLPSVETLRGDAPPVAPGEMFPAVIVIVEPGGARFVKPIARAAACRSASRSVELKSDGVPAAWKEMVTSVDDGGGGGGARGWGLGGGGGKYGGAGGDGGVGGGDGGGGLGDGGHEGGDGGDGGNGGGEGGGEGGGVGGGDGGGGDGGGEGGGDGGGGDGSGGCGLGGGGGG